MRLAIIATLSVLAIGCAGTESPTSSTPVGASPSTVSGGTLPPSTSGVTVSGRIVDFQTRTGVEGVTVEWGLRDSWTTATTDKSGAFTVPVKTTGLFDVAVRGVSPSFPSASIYVSDPQYSTIVYTGQSDCPRMYGRVFDARTSQPIAGATVDWIQVRALTTADGSYEVNLGCRPEGYGSGTSAVEVSHPQYIAQRAVGARREWIQQNELHRRDFALLPR